MENSEMNKLKRKSKEIPKTPVKVAKITSPGKKYSPRKSRATQIWYQCSKCHKKTKNRSMFCGEYQCTGRLNEIIAVNKSLGVYKLDDNICSVRRNIAGNLVRTFVNLKTRECSFCTTELNCRHVKAAQEEQSLNVQCTPTNCESMNQKDQDWVTKQASEVYILGEESIYCLKDNTEHFGFVHCSKVKCYVCQNSSSINSGPRKTGATCPHTLALFATIGDVNSEQSQEGNSQHFETMKEVCSNPIDYINSSKIQFNQIISAYPTHLNREETVKSQRNDEPMDIQEFLTEQYNSCIKCPNCTGTGLVNYKYNKNNASANFITMSTIVKVKFNVKFCEECFIIVYPDLSLYKMINCHTRLIFTFNVYLLVLNYLRNSSSVIKVLTEWIDQLADKSDIEILSAPNMAQDLYRTVLSVGAGVITQDCLNFVTCPICGRFPHITCGDGNVKDASRIPTNLIYNEEEEDIEDLFQFKNLAATELFTQNNTKKA